MKFGKSIFVVQNIKSLISACFERMEEEKLSPLSYNFKRPLKLNPPMDSLLSKVGHIEIKA